MERQDVFQERCLLGRSLWPCENRGEIGFERSTIKEVVLVELSHSLEQNAERGPLGWLGCKFSREGFRVLFADHRSQCVSDGRGVARFSEQRRC